MTKAFAQLKKHPIEFILIIIILALAAFLFFFRLEAYLHFANDEARDAFIVRDMIQNKHLISLGPEVSVGNFYLGPIYYYFLVPFFLIFSFKPIAGAVLIALLSIASVFLIYKVGKELFAAEVGIFSALLYATSFLVILHARWPWNLNPLPFFILLILLALAKLKFGENEKGKTWWFVILCGSLAISIQLHTTAFLLFPILILIWLWVRPKIEKKIAYLWGALAFLVLNIPMIYYELKSGFANFKGALAWFGGPRQGFNIVNAFSDNFKNFLEFFSALWLNNFYFWGGLILLGLIVVTIFLKIAVNKVSDPESEGLKMILVFFVVCFLAFPFLQEKMYLHYFIILFPIAFLLLGYFLASLWESGFGKIFAIPLAAFLIFINLSGIYHYWQGLEGGNWQGDFAIPFKDTEKTVEYMIEDSEGREFKIDVYDKEYYRAFEYVLEIQGIETKEDAKLRYMVETRPGADNKFGILEVVPKRGY